ncbi:MAG: tRNA pseudouridine(65) synthase TruC [Pseudomonadota bacterium]
MSIQILYQDEHLVAVHKPSGLLVHRSEIDRHETQFAVQIVRDQIGQRVYTLHRLDKPTSGILLFALSSDIARLMTEQFSANAVEKHYLAVVRGRIENPICIDYPLQEKLDKMTDAKAQKNKPPQEAITNIQTIATTELPYPVGRYPSTRYSLIKAIPKSGRKHQIRRHLKHIFHPIVGDTSYGDGKHNQFFREQFDCHRLLLMASHVSFMHPITQRKIIIEAGVDDVFTGIQEGLFAQCISH